MRKRNLVTGTLMLVASIAWEALDYWSVLDATVAKLKESGPLGVLIANVLISRIAILVLAAVGVAILWRALTEKELPPIMAAPTVSQTANPIFNANPVINIHNNPASPAAMPRSLVSPPKKDAPNLCPENLRQKVLRFEDGMWTDVAQQDSEAVLAIVIDILNSPMTGGPIGIAESVRACIQLPDQKQPVCALWWLHERTNTVSISRASQKTLVIATGPLLGGYDERPWCFPRNLKEHEDLGYFSKRTEPKIDYSSYFSEKDFLFDLIMVDADTGIHLAKWKLKWEMQGRGEYVAPNVLIVG
jgi:hypothetical protein